MGCKKNVVKFSKWAARTLGPILGRHILQTVGVLEDLSASIPDLLSGHDKRQVVIDSTLRKAQAIGHDAFDEAKAVTISEIERAARAAIESAVHNIREGVALEELADWADESEDVTV